MLVLRDAEQAEADARRLRERGVPAIAAPCLRFEPVAGVSLDRWRGAPADVVLASPRVVPALAGVPLDPAWRVLALAPRTARAAREAGIGVDVEVTGGGAELARAARPGVPLVAPTSDLGGDEVRRVRPDAEAVVAYRTTCPERLPDDARAALAGPFRLYAASPSALKNLETLAPGAVARAERVYAHGATTADAARALGARDVTDAHELEPR